MNDALYIAATGMQAQQQNVDTIANNLANVTTPGFKAGRVNFTDLVARDMQRAQGALGSDSTRGAGVGVAFMARLASQGELKRTEVPLDLAINGAGYIELSGPDGNALYSRGGSMLVNKDGLLTDAQGNPLKPSIHVGSDVRQLTIAADGRVMVRSGTQSTASEVGRIELATFSDPTALTSLGNNLYQASERSGEATSAMPGEQGGGTLVQGALEASNVKLVDEMVNLMAAQRAYEMNVKVIQASDEMLGMSNNLRR